jgi:hypothetical protein
MKGPIHGTFDHLINIKSLIRINDKVEISYWVLADLIVADLKSNSLKKTSHFDLMEKYFYKY